MSPKAVVLIITHKIKLTPNEEISILQCTKILKNHDIYFILPYGIKLDYYLEKFPIVKHFFVNKIWLSSYENSNRLKVLPILYNEFSNYEFILFHEPDAFVFKDELDFWMNKGYDYIGAPWFDGFDKANSNSSFVGVGNSGFSLRKVKSHLKVTHTFSHIRKPDEIKEENNRNFKGFGGKIYSYYNLIKQITISNNTHHWFNDFKGQEDLFWTKYAQRNFDWFKVAPIEEAIKFSFEMLPEKLYQLNNQNLPFGCHAWEKYDIKFWKPFIEKQGFVLPNDINS